MADLAGTLLVTGLRTRKGQLRKQVAPRHNTIWSNWSKRVFLRATGARRGCRLRIADETPSRTAQSPHGAGRLRKPSYEGAKEEGSMMGAEKGGERPPVPRRALV